MPFHRSLRIVAILLFVLAQSAFAQELKTKKKTPPVIEEINVAMQEFVDSGDISGAVTLVSHKGKIMHLGAVGMADIEKQKPMKPSNLFAIASMTKPIVATGLLMLQDEGKLSIDDEVKKYIPGFADLKLKDGTPVERPITIRDCITHTSGLAGKQIFEEDTLEAGVNALAMRPLAFQPGAKWQYSPGLNVCGRVIEVVSGQPLQTFLQQRIFTPMKMKQTTFFPGEKQIRRIVTLYNKKDGKLVVEEGFLGKLSEIKAPNPSGGLISSARDMCRFYQLMIRKGKFQKQQLLTESAVEQMTTPQTGELKTGFTPGNAWGLGWCIVREPQEISGMLSAGTFGHGGAFGTQGWVDPKTKTIYVLMIQRKGILNSDNSKMRRKFQEVAASKI